MGNFKEALAGVKAFVFDVDGVFTDGGITPTSDGDFLRTYHAKDGYAVAYAIKMGFKVVIISGGRGASLELRFRALGVTELHVNCSDKTRHLQAFLDKHALQPEQVIFMGDDIPDMDAMRMVGLPVCPADAVPEIVETAVYVSSFPGGKGCVRDIIEQVLRAQDAWARDCIGVNTVSA